VLGSTGGATGAGVGLLYFDWRIGGLRPTWASGAPPEAHAGVAFYAPDPRYNKRQKVKSR
jgi:hypothetical protein